MKITDNRQTQSTLKKHDMKRGCVYINKAWPLTPFLATAHKGDNSGVGGVVNLNASLYTPIEIMLSDGWTEVEAEVILK